MTAPLVAKGKRGQPTLDGGEMGRREAAISITQVTNCAAVDDDDGGDVVGLGLKADSAFNRTTEGE